MKKFRLFCMFMLVLFLFSGSSFAGDFGFYIEAASGSGEMEYEDDYLGDDEWDNDVSVASIGFQLESNALGKSSGVFSFRFQAGLELRELDYDGYFGDVDVLDMYGISTKYTFAFGGDINNKVRLWAGPQLMLGLFTSSSEDWADEYEMDFGWMFGVGVAGGANVALGNRAVFTATLGYRVTGTLGFTDLDWDYEDDTDDEYDLTTGNGGEAFVSVGFMF